MEKHAALVAIHVETAETLRHPFAVGLAEFELRNIEPLEVWQARIDPETEFSRTLRVIDEVTGANLRPEHTFPTIHPLLREWLNGKIVAAHGDQAQRALDAACHRYGLKAFDCRWVDTQSVARAALHRRCEDQYRLESLAAWLGVDLPHGDFARRATAVGQVALWCAAILQTSIGDLLDLPGGEFRSTVSDLPSLPPRSSATGT